MARLVGPDAMERIARGHVGVFGLGGVGSYAVEALARSGVGRMTLVDFDAVCITNFNRQLHAVQGAVGKSKAALMAERARAINPAVTLRVEHAFYNKNSAEPLLSDPPDILLDCIDNVTAKMHLLVECLQRGISVVTLLGAAAKLDPTRIRVVPLTETYTDPLARAMRKFTKRRHGVTDEDLRRVIAVFSDEPVINPHAGYRSPVCGNDCVCPGGENDLHSCQKRNVIHGSAVFVTAVFGMVAASVAVRHLAGLPWEFTPPRTPSAGRAKPRDRKRVRRIEP
jgi:tRNA A37 threonylcarbamoyladenosine dehydratase